MQQQPGMAPFSAPSPISSRPPPVAVAVSAGKQQQQQQQLEEQLGSGNGSGSGSVGHDGPAAGEEGGSSAAAGGNRWPRQETLALLKIRSEMDAAFREAALKGPLWEEVSRKLAEMGYRRGAKKCREKFENVDKYYKRTKDGRAGRGDGKTYRFFTELEKLHSATSAHHQPPPAPVTPISAAYGLPSAARVVPVEPSPPTPAFVPQLQAPRTTTTTTAPAPAAPPVMTTMGDDVSFYSSGSDGEDTEETAGCGSKRKRRSGGGGGGGKAMRLFEELMRQVMERQETMQQRLLEAIERRDHDRMLREEAWRRQEVARLAREQDALAQDRAVAASRDAAVISFIHRVTGQSIPLPSITGIPVATIVSPTPTLHQPTPVASAAPPPSQHQQAPPPSAQQLQQQQQQIMPVTPQPRLQPHQPHQADSKNAVVLRAPEPPQHDTAAAGGASSSRWPKTEVHALIQLRTEMEARYQDAAPKGPLWEDISAGMRRIGYSRSAKRCKEKWENINKYFKKVKESSKKRPEDSKTCPYYHQLDALYRSKANAAASSPANAPLAAAVTVLAPVPLSQTAPPLHVEHKDCSNGHGNGNGWPSKPGSTTNNGGTQAVKTTNGGSAAASFSVEGAGAGAGNNVIATNKGLKQEDVVKETTAAATTAEQRQPQPQAPQPLAMNHSYGRSDRMVDDDMDSDSMDDEDDDEFDDEDDDDVAAGGNKMQPAKYDFQRPQQNHQNVVVRPNASNGAGNPPPASSAAPAATSGASFLAMVQ